MALHALLQDKKYSVEYLLTNVNASFERVSMHGLRVSLLEQQLQAIGISNGILELSEHTTNLEYEERMAEKVRLLKNDGFKCAAFGDIFLDDLREYRERQLHALGMKTVFPLWKKETKSLMHDFIDSGFKAITVCVQANILDQSFVGRVIDADFLRDLPSGVDASGENGEFHTFCFDATFFSHPIDFSMGETVYREYTNGDDKNGFWFCDLLPR